jgi:hypothetical protein
MGDNQDDTPRYSKAQVQEMLREHEKQTVASMSPNIDEIVATSIAKHLETISLKPSTSPSVDSGASKSSTIPPGTSGKDGEFYNIVGHGYFTPTQMPHYNNSGNSRMYDGTHFPFWKSSMESHLRSCSEELWEVVVQGYKPLDPNDLSPVTIIIANSMPRLGTRFAMGFIANAMIKSRTLSPPRIFGRGLSFSKKELLLYKSQITKMQKETWTTLSSKMEKLFVKPM